MTTKTELSGGLEQFRARWMGRELHASSVAKIHYGSPQDRTFTIIRIWISRDDEWIAWCGANGEHHRATSMEALERRLHSLAVRSDG